MRHSVTLRLLFALVGAVAITVAVFWFMHGLIEAGQSEQAELRVFQQVEIIKPSPQEREPEPLPESREQMQREPGVGTPRPMAPIPVTKLTPEMPTLDLSLGDMAVQKVGERFTAPAGANGVDFGGGQDAQGFVEVVPYNTRKPNVPELAWRNKINGWVRVAFSVTPDGSTRNVRVLDARPRGVFEEKVVAAVEDWQYSISFSGREAANVVLTQRVDVRWQDYTQNVPNVD